ncbi:MAG: C40 family peptidase [Formivibrio sp.]|nr:C40 family peptidase [Formivibrio sp.]
MAALISVLAMHSPHADELNASATAGSIDVTRPATNLVPSTESTATAASEPATKPRKPAASQTTRKVATDYAPAQDLLLSAMSLIGVKYKWGGNTPESGLDCSGFIRYVFQNALNIALPRTALGMSRTGDPIDKDELKPGDLVFFNTLKRRFSHVGIYLGDNRFIHSPRTGSHIEVSNLDDKYWTSRFDGARRMSELDNENIDVQALLQNRPARAPSQASVSVSAENKSCRKVVLKRKGKKITQTICSSSKPSVAKTASKAKKIAHPTQNTHRPANKKPSPSKKKKR